MQLHLFRDDGLVSKDIPPFTGRIAGKEIKISEKSFELFLFFAFSPDGRMIKNRSLRW
jgi:hypothetical protein